MQLTYYTKPNQKVSFKAGTPPRQVHPPWAGTPPGRYTPRTGTPPWVGTPPRQIHPLGRYTPGQVHQPMAMHAGIRSTSGRYASYWNAFLFLLKFDQWFVDRSTTIPVETRIVIYPLNATPALAFKFSSLHNLH